jgi:hypothetical protein
LYSRICKAPLEFPEHLSSASKNFLNKIFKKEAGTRPTVRDLLKDQWLIFTEYEYECFLKGNFTGSISYQYGNPNMMSNRS